MWSDGLKKQFQGPPTPDQLARLHCLVRRYQSINTYRPTYLPACLPTYLSTNLSIYLSIYTLHYGVNALPVLC